MLVTYYQKDLGLVATMKSVLPSTSCVHAYKHVQYSLRSSDSVINLCVQKYCAWLR